MDAPFTRIAERFKNERPSIFARMTALATEHHAVNLGQGFPDFPGPEKVLTAIARQVKLCHNQYAPSCGEPALRKAVACYVEAVTQRSYDPESEITITTGATEGIYCAINAFVNPGDRVLVFEPAFDLYGQALAAANATVVPIHMKPPSLENGESQGWSIDWDEFETVTAGGFSLAIINSPHNPTGKVFTREELERIAEKVLEHNAVVICDEVYENLVYDGLPFVSLSGFPQMKNHCVRISSAAKTLGLTGLKTGWVCAAKHLTAEVRLVHQSTVFCNSPYTQLGIAEAINDTEWFKGYLALQKEEFLRKRNLLRLSLEKSGYIVPQSQGAFFLLADYSGIMRQVSESDYAENLIQRQKIATIPLSAFYTKPPATQKWIRFAFCKTDSTLQQAARLLLPQPD